MPAIEIDQLGTRFYYYDSGVPALNDVPYTTLVMLNGMVFNHYTFQRLLPLAAASHIRLILLNRRGYGGSTPLDASHTTPDYPTRSEELYETFLQNRAKEIATFLVKLIEIENIPPKVEAPGRASGGISLGAWSLGNAVVMSFLAFSDILEPGLANKLEQQYLRKIVSYDPPYHTFGFPIPKNAYGPFWDAEIPPEEREGRFAVWVSSYWSHDPKFLEAPVDDLLDKYLEQRKPNPSKPATVTRFTPDEVAKGIQVVTHKQGDYTVLEDHHRPVNLEVLRLVLFGKAGDSSAKKPFVNIPIAYLRCTEAHWDPQISVPFLKAEMQSPPPGYVLQRSIKFSDIEGTNHYAHYDEPVKTFAALSQALEF